MIFRHSAKLLSLLLMLACAPAVSFAEPQVGSRQGNSERQQAVDEFEVLKVYVRQSELMRLLKLESMELNSESFEPIEIGRLERLLQAREESRALQVVDRPTLEEAIYVGRLDNGAIVSETSRLKTSGEGLLRLGECSLALTRARGVPLNGLQLLDEHLMSPSGAIELEVGQDKQAFWFGFSLVNQGRVKQDFQLDLPIAAHSLFLLSTPETTTLESSNALVESIANPIDVLPEDWPDISNLARSTMLANRKWWIIYLSGRDTVNLTATEESLDNDGWFRHLLQDCDLRYEFTPPMVKIQGTFRLMDSQSQLPLRIRISNGVRISSVLYNGSPVDWKVRPSLTSGEVLVEIDRASIQELRDGRDTGLPPLPTDGGGDDAEDVDLALAQEASAELQVVGSFPFVGRPNGELTDLPQLALAESFVVSGKCTISCNEGYSIQRTEASSGKLEMRLGPTEDSGLGSASLTPVQPLHWHLSWTGDTPLIRVRLTEDNRVWEAEGLHRFSFNPKWLAAESYLRIRSADLSTNEVRIQVGEDWIVDNAELVGNQLSDMQVSIAEPNEQHPETEVVINWIDRRRSLEVDLRVTGHRQLKESGERIRRILSVPDANQVDHYVLNSNSRYRIRLTANLLMFQKQAYELPTWQRSLIDVDESPWIFQGVRKNVPPIQLMRDRGWFQVDSVAAFEQDAESGILVHHLSNISPSSGSLEQLRIWIPYADALAGLQFRQMETGEPLKYEVIEASDSGFLLSVQLLDAKETPFAVACQFRTSQRVLRFPRYLDSTSTQTLLAVPHSMSAWLDLKVAVHGGLELLPVQTALENQSFQSYLASNSKSFPQDASDYLLARADLALLSEIQLLKSNSTSSKSVSWVLAETVEHELQNLGQQTHRLRWDVINSNADGLQISVPSDWLIRAVRVNGERLLLDSSDSAELTIPLASHRVSRVEAEFESRTTSNAWLSKQQFPKPTLNVPVKRSSQTLLLPPSLTSFAVYADPQVDDSLFSRVAPKRWWLWLTPTKLNLERNSILYSDSDNYGWSKVELLSARNPERTPAIWLAHRTAIAGLAIAIVLFLASVLYLIFIRSLRFQWTVLCGAAILVLLVPSTYLPLADILLLSACLACLARVISVIYAERGKNGSSRSVRSRSIPKLTFSIAFWAVAFSVGQVSAQNLERSANGNENTTVKRILIPLDDELKSVENTHAYIPESLFRSLEAEQSRASQLSSPRVLSAEYSLRLNPSTSSALRLVDEFVLSLQVNVPDPSQQLRLPFLQSELPLVIDRCEVDGVQANMNEVSLRQDTTAIVFSPSNFGQYRLRLSFSPSASLDTNGRASFQVQVPPFPSATMRVLTDSNTRVELNSLGSPKSITSQKKFSLGPVSLINCSWISKPNQIIASQAVSTSTHIWVHANANQLAATAAIVVNNPSALPEVFRVSIDENWEVVGGQWGDAEIASSQRRQLRSQRTFDLRFTDVAKRFSNQAIIRFVLTPRFNPLDSSGSLQLAIPRLLESRVNDQQTMAWSQTNESSWVPQIPANWVSTEPSVNSKVWGPIQWSDTRKAYQLPTTTSACQFATIPDAEDSAVSEINVVHLNASEVRMQYVAQWTKPLQEEGVLSLRIPKRSRITSCQINNFETAYQLQQGTEEDNLLIFTGDIPEKTSSVSLDLAYPSSIGRQQQFHRILLDDAVVSNSVLRVLRRSGVRCDIEPMEERAIELERVRIRPTELLSNLEALVGQTELGSDLRDRCALPLSFRLRRMGLAAEFLAVLYVERQQTQWRGRLEIEPQGETDCDFLFLRLPAQTADSLEVDNLFEVIPSGDPALATVAVLSKSQLTEELSPTSEPERFSLQFDLDFSSVNNQVSIPEIEILTNQTQYPVVALPQEVGAEKLRWRVANTPVSDDFVIPFDTEQTYDYFIGADAPSLAVWQSIDQTETQAELIATRWVVESVSNSSQAVSGFGEFWIEPNGTTSLTIPLPSGISVLGATVGEAIANTSIEEKQVSILLQPNSAPLRLRLHTRWQVEEESPRLDLLVPSNVARMDTRVLVDVIPSDWKLETPAIESAVTEYGKRWHSTLEAAIPKLRRLSTAQRDLWLKSWSPDALGINRELILRLTDASEETTQAIRIGDYWDSVCQRMNFSDPKPSSVSTFLPGGIETSAMYYEFPNQTFRLIRLSNPSGFQARVLAALALLVAFAVTYLLAAYLKKRYFAFLSRYPWVYWVQISLLCYLLLPVAWPSLIIAVAAATLAAGQWLDFRRVTQYQ